MESRQIAWFAPECSEEELARMDILEQTDTDIYEEMERKEGADNATGRLDNVDWCRGLILPGLSDYADCRCRLMSELPSAPTATVDQLSETTRSNAIAHVIYTSRINRFPINCPARRTHRHFVYL